MRFMVHNLNGTTQTSIFGSPLKSLVFHEVCLALLILYDIFEKTSF